MSARASWAVSLVNKRKVNREFRVNRVTEYNKEETVMEIDGEVVDVDDIVIVVLGHQDTLAEHM